MERICENCKHSATESFDEPCYSCNIDRHNFQEKQTHPLQKAFDAAIHQATQGKGVRHGGGATPFMDQRWHQIAKSTGIGGLGFQACKKLQEAFEKEDQESFERELLGAIVYAGAAYLYSQEHGFKK